MKAQLLDVFATLPQTIIETILCLLPIEEAARTSILSKEWRYKWTTIPKLVFCESMIDKRTQGKQTSDLKSKRCYMDPTCKLFYAIFQVLLLRQGPIQEFTVKESSAHPCIGIDQILLHLSRNHTMLKKLTLDLYEIDLPLSLFSLHQLTNLSLSWCGINHKPIFNGFCNLKSLSLENVWMYKESLLHLLSACPSLKSLKLLFEDDMLVGVETPTIMEYFKCLPVIEHMTTSCCFTEYGVEVSVPEELPALLIHLKCFCFEKMKIFESSGWTFLYVLIKCSPNLQKIKLEMNPDYNSDEESEFKFIAFEEYSNVWLEHLNVSNVWLEHLNVLEIDLFVNCKTVLEFVKTILVRSPNLKKVRLKTCMYDKSEELEMLKILLSLPRASHRC